MRLTLRTLLAYLEDELKPSESKEIGQKIAASPVATSLAQRIREVMRRRRLSAEDLNESGLDANIVAYFKALAGGRGYQTLINDALRNIILAEDLEALLGRVIRESLAEYVLQKPARVSRGAAPLGC